MTKTTIQKTMFMLMFLMSSLAYTQQPQEGNMMPLVRRAYLPHYPLLPSGAREAGEVVVFLSLDPEGKVKNAEPSGASEGLRREAEFAAREWRFAGHTKSLSVVFSFALYGEGETPCRPSITLDNPIRVEVCEQRKAVVVISDPPLVDLSKPDKK